MQIAKNEGSKQEPTTPPERCSGNFRLSLPCGHWSLIPSCGTGRLAKTWRWHSSTTISGVWVLRDLGNTGFTDIDSFTRYHSIPFDSIRVKGTKFERPRAGHLLGYSSGFSQAAKDPIAHKPCDPGDHRDEAKIGPKHLPSKLGRPIFGMYNWVMCFFLFTVVFFRWFEIDDLKFSPAAELPPPSF